MFQFNWTDYGNDDNVQSFDFENQTQRPFHRSEDYSEVVQLILTKIVRPPVMIFGIIGNLLNILILARHKSRRTRSAMTFLIAMSAMDLTQLIVQIIFVILEWIKAFSVVTATIMTYYRCYVKYVNIPFY